MFNNIILNIFNLCELSHLCHTQRGHVSHSNIILILDEVHMMVIHRYKTLK